MTIRSSSSGDRDSFFPLVAGREGGSAMGGRCAASRDVQFRFVQSIFQINRPGETGATRQGRCEDRTARESINDSR